MVTQEIKVPNIGGVNDVEVIEVLVSPGQQVKKDDSLITLESDKASMEIPSPIAGTVKNIQVKVGDKVSEGSTILTLDAEEVSSAKPEPSVEIKAQPELKEESSPVSSTSELKVYIPDIGDAKNVEVIEILAHPGDHVDKEASLITLEGEKATMEIPSPYAGEIKNISLKIGDKVSKGDEILTLLVKTATPENIKRETTQKEAISSPPVPAVKDTAPVDKEEITAPASEVHAGPAVRRLARELGVNLSKVKGSGPKGRILTEDLHKYVKSALTEGANFKGEGFQIGKMPEIDFSKFGEIERVPLTKIKKLTGANVHRSWVTIPHVTQFDQADITDMEEFRKSRKEQFEKLGIKLTPLVFIMKAVVAALKKYPHFNASLDSSGENLIVKKYFNLGIAVDTPSGLVVPVIKDVDKKAMGELAADLAQLSQKAKQKGLSPGDMSGSCFTISSLGGIGGTAFTPIVNGPDVAILGVSKSSIAPVYKNGQFVPRLMLPLSLSYDHRVVDGADGARFLVFLANCLADIRTLLL